MSFFLGDYSLEDNLTLLLFYVKVGTLANIKPTHIIMKERELLMKKVVTMALPAYNIFEEMKHDFVVVTDGEYALANCTNETIKVMAPDATTFSEELKKFVCKDENAQPMLVIPPSGIPVWGEQERRSSIDDAFGIRLDDVGFTPLSGYPDKVKGFDRDHVRYIVTREYIAGAQTDAYLSLDRLDTENLLVVGPTAVRSVNDPTVVGAVSLERVPLPFLPCVF